MDVVLNGVGISLFNFPIILFSTNNHVISPILLICNPRIVTLATPVAFGHSLPSIMRSLWCYRNAGLVFQK